MTADPAGGSMALLASGVPLSLLMDLVFGPNSEELLRCERPSERGVPEPRPA
ncbi:MAG: hypothetical protein ACLGIG_01985 [Actinomycetes bacterium]